MSLGLRILNIFLCPEFNYAWNYFSTHLRIDSLFFGGTARAYLTRYHQLDERLGWFHPLGLVLPWELFY